MMKALSSNHELSGKSVLWTRRIMAILLVCLVLFLLIMEILVFSSYVIPAVSIGFWQLQGIAFDGSLTISEFSAEYASIMFMVWMLPSVFFVIVMGCLHYKLFMFFWNKILRWCKTALKGTVLSEENK